jgi:hypothetical protein
MNTSTGNQDTSRTGQLDATTAQAMETALYYPSLKGNGWDDELLPSGD